MIYEPEETIDTNTLFSYDVGRPDIHDDKSREYWKSFNEYIKTCN